MALNNLGTFGALLELDKKRFKMKMSEASKDVKGFARNLKLLDKISFKGLAKNLLSVQTAIAGTTLLGIGAAVRAFSEYQQEMANVSTLIKGDVVPQMDRLKGQLLEIPSVLGNVTDLAEGLYQALSAGVDPDNAVEFVHKVAKAAVGSLADLRTMIDGVTTVMNAFGKEVGEVDQVLDQMFVAIREGKTTGQELSANMGKVANIFSVAGLSTAELFAALSTLTTTMDGTDIAAVSLRQVINTILKPTTQAKKVFEALNIPIGEAGIKSQGLQKILLKLKIAAEGNEDVFAELFGNIRAFTGVVSLAGKSNERFNEILRMAQEEQGAAEEATRRNHNTLHAFANMIKNEVIKQIVMFGDKVAQSFGANIVDAEHTVENFGKILKGFGEYAAFLIGIVIKLGKAVWWLTTPARAVIGFIYDLIQEIKDKFYKFIQRSRTSTH